MTLPATAYDACEKRSTRVSSLSMVRYRNSDYPVPVAYAHHEVLVRGYVHEVVISCGAEVIARHRRSYAQEDLVFDPVHYLPLLEKKINALDQAAPLRGWELPDQFATPRRLLEARMGKAGKREYVQVLRLMETFGADVAHGCRKGRIAPGRHWLWRGQTSAAVPARRRSRHVVSLARLWRAGRRPPKLDLDVYPYLPRARVQTTSPGSYMSLLGSAA